jgi:deoxyribose-phosphate aldolase
VRSAMQKIRKIDANTLTLAQLAAMIDHTLLRPYATQLDVDEICEEAALHGFAAVSVNPVWTSYCAKRLANTNVGINATIGFPLGSNTAHIKVEESVEAVRNGATELDMVINVGALKSGYPAYVEREIAAVVKAVPRTPVKVILECSYLSDEEKVAVCEMSMKAGAAFVKTSTGFADGGATIEDIRLMRGTVGMALGVKAAGGIRNYIDVVNMIEAGASRIGTSSGMAILQEMKRSKD